MEITRTEQVARYRACASQIGECYCAKRQTRPCYMGELADRAPQPAKDDPRRLAAAAFTLACLGLIGWPLGILAFAMATRAARRGGGRLAVVAGTLATAECVLTVWVAALIITYQLHI